MTATLPTLIALLFLAGGGAFDQESYGERISLDRFVERTLEEHPELLARDQGRDTAWHHPVQKVRVTAIELYAVFMGAASSRP